MTVQVTVRPELLRWARERASLAPAELADRLGWKNADRVQQWEETGGLTLDHLERLAEKTHTPVGYFFLPKPPDEQLPISDFRTVEGARSDQPSPDLLDTIYACQLRQDWYREHLIRQDSDPLSFVGSARLPDNPEMVAEDIRRTIYFDLDARAEMSSWAEALRAMADGAENAGTLVMRNGVVGNNSRRKLSVEEFRGFALSDPYAPLVFVNASDAQAAQMFTLAHELAHIWLNSTGVSNWRLNPDRAVERRCNVIAAEMLVPARVFTSLWNRADDEIGQAEHLARRFKTSVLVILIRAREAQLITDAVFERLYAQAMGRIRERTGGGGDFYKTQGSRLGKRFARAVTSSALEGDIPYREAFQLLGVKKSATFNELARSLGVTS